MTGTTQEVAEALKDMGYEVLKGKGGFFIRKDDETQHISTSKARRMTGISAPPRKTRERVSSYGDWATVAAINGIKE